MKSGDGFILVFSLTSMDSLNELASMRDQILRQKETDGYNAVRSFAAKGEIADTWCRAISRWSSWAIKANYAESPSCFS